MTLKNAALLDVMRKPTVLFYTPFSICPPPTTAALHSSSSTTSFCRQIKMIFLSSYTKGPWKRRYVK